MTGRGCVFCSEMYLVATYSVMWVAFSSSASASKPLLRPRSQIFNSQSEFTRRLPEKKCKRWKYCGRSISRTWLEIPMYHMGSVNVLHSPKDLIDKILNVSISNLLTRTDNLMKIGYIKRSCERDAFGISLVLLPSIG